MTATGTFCGLYLASYLPLVFVLMNNSCWHLDIFLITAEALNDDLQQDENFDREKAVKTNENLKKIVKRCKKFVDWQVESLILCLSIYVLSFSVAAGMMIILFIFCTIQISIMC